MICPLCGYEQPENVKECVQCHTPFAGKASNWRAERDQTGKETGTIARIERRRRPRPRERTVTRERGVAKEQKEQMIPREQRIIEESPLPPPPVKETTPQHEPPPSPLREERTPAPGSSVTQLVDRLKQVVVTTTPDVQDRAVAEYKVVVTAGAVVKLEGLDHYAGEIKDVGALRAAPFYDQIKKARDIAMTDLKIEAAKLGANGVVGVTLQFEQSQKEHQDGLLIWIVATGTAVVLTD